jgi:hypothetical protein
MADEARFRNVMTVMDFETSAPAYMKDAFEFQTYFPQWPANVNTATGDDGYFSSGYDTTPSLDPDQYIAPACTQSSSLFAQPRPMIKADEPTYPYFAGELVASPTVAEPVDEQYDENFAAFPIPMEGQNTQPTPSTTVQEQDQRSEPEVDDDDDEPLKSRPSRKNTKKESTPAGQAKGGNNPFGSKGTKTCGSCRKRKGKVRHLT